MIELPITWRAATSWGASLLGGSAIGCRELAGTQGVDKRASSSVMVAGEDSSRRTPSLKDPSVLGGGMSEMVAEQLGSGVTGACGSTL